MNFQSGSVPFIKGVPMKPLGASPNDENGMAPDVGLALWAEARDGLTSGDRLPVVMTRCPAIGHLSLLAWVRLALPRRSNPHRTPEARDAEHLAYHH
jgi:hypothetical protein